MTEFTINVFNESRFEHGLTKPLIADAFQILCKDHNKLPGWLNVILMQTKGHNSLNFKYLQHDYETDVLTFNFNEPDQINGEIYINIEVAKVNATALEQPLTTELNRLIIHGILHLLGFDDDTDEQREYMRSLEDKYLSCFM